MADVKKTVEVIFNATDNVSSKAKNIGASLGSIASPIAGATTSILKVEAAAAATAAAIGGLAIKLAGDFQVGIKSIGTLSDATDKQLGALSGSMLKYSANSTSTAGQLLKASFDAKSAGVRFGDMMGFIASADKLAVAGGTDVSATTSLMTTTMNGFGIAADEAGRVSDILFASMQGGIQTIDTMNGSFSTAAPAAKSAKVSLEEYAASFSTVTSVLGSSSRASTQLQALFNELSKPTANLSKAMAKLGIDVKSASFQNKTLADKMELVKKAAGGTAGKTKLLFSSIEAGSAAFIIAQNNMKKYNAELDRQANSNGVVEQSYKDLINTLNNQTKIAVNSATAALTGFGQPLLASFTDVASGVAAIFQALGVSISNGALADITDKVNAWSSSLAKNLDGVASSLPAAFNMVDFSPLLDALGGVGASLGGVFDGLDLTKPKDLALAMNEVIKVMGGVVQATAGVFSVLADLASFIISAAKEWGSMSAAQQEMIGTIGGLAIAFTAVAPAVGVLYVALGLGNTGLKTMAGSSSKLVSSLGKAGLIGAAAAAGYAMGTLAEKFLIPDTWKQSMQDTIGWLDRISGGLISGKDAAQAYANQPVPFDKVTQAAIDNASAIEKSAASMRNAISASSAADMPNSLYAKRLADISRNALDTTVKTAAMERATIASTSASKDATTQINAQANAIMSVASSTETAQGKALALAKSYSEITRTVDSLGRVTFTNLTQQSSNSLLNAPNASNKLDKQKISTQKDATAAQNKVANEIAAMGSKPLTIDVTSDGLAPELEAFMWKILDRIQIRAAADKSEYLKGLASGAVVP